MPKTKISDFSTTAGNNTDINSINIAEGCAPSGINDAIRTLMAQLKDWQSGAVAQDNTFNGVVGALAQNPVRMYDTDSSNYVALRAPGTVSSNVTWTLPDTDGTANQVLKTDGAGVLGWVTGASGDVTTTGTQTLTNKTINGSNNTITNVSLVTGVTGTLPVANGGTGATALTANNVLLGNGTGALQVVAPGTNGNVLTSNGTTWTSSAPAGGGAWTFIASATASNSASVSFNNIGSTYDFYVVTLSRVRTSVNGDFLRMRTSSNNGSSFDNGTSDYLVTTYNQFGSTAALSSTGSTGRSSIALMIETSSRGVGNGSDMSVSGMVYLVRPSDSLNGFIRSDLFHQGNSTNASASTSVGIRASSSAIDAIQFFFMTGDITSGTFRLYGIKNS